MIEYRTSGTISIGFRLFSSLFCSSQCDAAWRMKIRRVGDSLLRLPSSPLLSFLVPSVYCSCRRPTQHPPYNTLFRFSVPHRSIIINTGVHRASAASTAAQAQETDDEGDPSQPPSWQSPPQEAPIRNDISNLLDETLSDKPRRSPISSMLYENTRYYSFTPVRDEARRAAAGRHGYQDDRQGRILEGMNFSNRNSEIYRAPAADIAPPTKPRAVRTIHSRPSLGRTIEIDRERGVDLARGLSKLQYELTTNRVRRDQFRQRFHERPGLKRKRLKRERWRLRFKTSFIAIVDKVKEMRRQGW